MSAHPQERALRAGLAALDLSFSDAQVGQLLAYLDWIGKWNRVYNLTALREPSDMLTHHLLDSLAVVAPFKRGLGQGAAARVLDVGSGAGLPGVVLAIACPDVKVDCVDAVAKKAAFVQQVAVALGLTNLRGVHARVEKLSDRYQLVCSRAFASLVDFTAWSANTLSEDGVWMALKGKRPTEEMAALPASVSVFHVEPLQVPGLDAERCIVWMRPSLQP